MKVLHTVVPHTLYIACDGTEFDTPEACENYEKSIALIYIKPEWIEHRQKQISENNQVKEILLAYMDENKKYTLTDLYFEILPQLTFLRKRMTVQRLMHITRQMCWDDDTLSRTYIKRQVYFIKN